jgi:hypothetical protein
MEQVTAMGRLSVPDEVVAQIAGRHAIATAAVAGLLRPGSSPGSPLLPVDRLARGVALSADGGHVRLVVYAAARLGIQADALTRAAAQTADAVAAALGGGVEVEVEIRILAVRQRRRRVATTAFRATAGGEGPSGENDAT